jgi:putative membrane protein
MLLRMLTFWALNVLLLWTAAEVFDSVRYSGATSLLLAGLLFGVAHTVIKPLLILLTLPLTVLTLGLFVLVINALILLLVAAVVPGFQVAGFGAAVLVALFISCMSLALNLLFGRR